MEFVKVGKNYMIKGSNGRVVSEKEKLELENKELIIKDITGCECQKETTKKISKNKKRIKEIMEEENKKPYVKVETYDEEQLTIDTVLKEEVQDDTIEETNKSI